MLQGQWFVTTIMALLTSVPADALNVVPSHPIQPFVGETATLVIVIDPLCRQFVDRTGTHHVQLPIVTRPPGAGQLLGSLLVTV